MANTDQHKAFSGIGWGYPPTFLKGSNQVIMTQDIANIEENLTLLFETGMGERPFNLDYGTKLNNMLFQPVGLLPEKEIEDDLKYTINLNEPRIDVDDVSLDLSRQTEGMVLIKLTYTQKEINSRHNFVYPFYYNEGTSLKL